MRAQVVQRGVPLSLTVVRAHGLGDTSHVLCRFWVRGKNPDAKFQTPLAEEGRCSDHVWTFQQKVPGTEEGDVVEFEILGGRPGSTESTRVWRGVLVLARGHFSAGRKELEVPVVESTADGSVGSLQIRVRALGAGALPSPRETLGWSPRGWGRTSCASSLPQSPQVSTLPEAGDDEPVVFK